MLYESLYFEPSPTRNAHNLLDSNVGCFSIFPSYIFFTLVNKTQFMIWFVPFPDEELITERNV